MAVIEVYADTWCPFAHVGLRTVVRRRKELGRDDVALRVWAWPLELGRDISSPDVLADVASSYGLGHPDTEDEGAVRIEWHEGESRGVKGSPHFFCGKFDAFCPSLDISRDAAGQLLLRNVETIDAFLAKCLRS